MRGQAHDGDALSVERLNDRARDGSIVGFPRRAEGQQQIGERLAQLGRVHRPLQQQCLHLVGQACESGIAQQPRRFPPIGVRRGPRRWR